MIAPTAKPPRPGRVLIIKPSSLGDVVTAVPVLRGLRRTFPQAHIAWMLSTACAALMEGDSDLDEVVLFDRKRLGKAWRSPAAAWRLAALLRALHRGRYDWVIDLQGLFRSGFFARASGAPLRAGFADAREGAWLFYTDRHRPQQPHTVDRNLALARQVGIDARPEDMTLQVPAAGREFGESVCRRLGVPAGGFVVCVPPTRWVTKRYPVRHWRTVVSSLSRRMPVALVGMAGDRELCEEAGGAASERAVNLAGETTVPEMVGLIAASAGVVCSDSAAKFIAPAVGVDAVVLIGPTRIDQTGPYLRGRCVVADVPCQGCLKRRCRHVTCMELIAPQTVIAAAEEMLDGRM